MKLTSFKNSVSDKCHITNTHKRPTKSGFLFQKSLDFLFIFRIEIETTILCMSCTNFSFFFFFFFNFFFKFPCFKIICAVDSNIRFLDCQEKLTDEKNVFRELPLQCESTDVLTSLNAVLSLFFGGFSHGRFCVCMCLLHSPPPLWSPFSYGGVA